MTEILQSSFRALSGRRSFLRRSGGAVLSATAIALLAGSESLAAEHKKGGGSSANDAMILNTLLGAEYEAVAAYQVAAESGLLQKPVLDFAVQFQSQHGAHAGLLTKTVQRLGGKPVEAKNSADYKFPVQTLKTQTDVLRFAVGLEQGAMHAYLDAAPRFDHRDLAKAVASILGDEAMHFAILRQALGENPVPEAFVS